MLLFRSKRLLLVICFFVLFVTSTFAQGVGDFQSNAATGNWNATSSWQQCFVAGVWAAATSTPTSASAVITIRSGHTITVTASVAADQLTIASGGAVTVNSTFALTIANGTGTDLTVSSGGTITNNGTVTLNGSTVTTVTGTIINGGTIIPLGTSLTFQASSLYRHNLPSPGAAGAIPSASWNSISTCEILSCGNTGVGPTGLGQGFGHFIWNNAAQPSDISLQGGMNTPTTGNFTLQSTNGYTLILVTTGTAPATSIGGNFILNSGNITILKLPSFINVNPQLSIAGTYSQNAGVMTINGSAGTGGGTGNATLTVGGISTISGGIVNICNSTWVGAGGNGTYVATGAITLSGAATINGCSSSATASTGASGTITATAGITINVGGTLNLNTSTTTGGGGSTVLNSAGTVTLSGGIINMASGAAVAASGCNGTISVTGGAGMTVSSGTLNLSSSLTTTGGGNGIVNVSIGAFNHTGGTVSKTGGNSGTININGTTAQTVRSGGFTTANTIAFNIIQSLAAGTTTIATSLTIASGTTFNINENGSNAADYTVALPFVNNGVVNVNTSAELDMGTTIMTGTGNFRTFTDATLLTKDPNGIAATTLTGSIQVSGSRTYASDGNYTYNGTAAQITGDGLPTTLNGGILNIANTLAPATGGVTLTQATTILEGASTTGMLLFGGTTNGRLITTSTNLITLGDDVTVSPIGGTTAKFVAGPIKKIGDDLFIFPTGKVYLATGPISTAKWARIEISAPTNTTDEFIAEYFKVNDPCNVSQVVSSTNGAGINNVSWKEYWTLTRTSAAAVTPTVKLYWQTGSSSSSPGSAISSTAAADLHVAECISLTWTDKGAGTVSGVAAGPGTILSSIGTTFTTGTAMPFTFASPSGVNPLPIELLTFSGNPTVNGNQITWSTATETNNDYFDLERSIDGIEFMKITTVNGAGNSTSVKNYDHLDAKPFAGINYYRLKQVDNNGEYSYYTVIALNNVSEENKAVQVYPNPSNGSVTIVASENIASLVIYNILGEVVYSNSSDQQKIQFEPLTKGIYVISAISKEGKTITTRFVKN